MLGVMAGAIITAANAAAHKVPVEYGVVVSGVVPGHAAERAGLQANDVIVRFDGLDVRPQERNLFAVLAQRKVGDVIEVEYVRDGQVQTVQVELMSRPMFDYPSLAELADQMVQPFIEANRELEALFAGVSEHDANAKPDPERWSANEVVAHLINTERDAQTFIASLAVGTELEVFSGNLDARVAATARRYGTTAALLKALKDTHAETSEMIRQLPKAFLERRASVVRLQLSAQVAAFHTRHHFAQITRALQDARA
jgi:membrane-associated protease RseP (regulator of RpoE activity)